MGHMKTTMKSVFSAALFLFLCSFSVGALAGEEGEEEDLKGEKKAEHEKELQLFIQDMPQARFVVASIVGASYMPKGNADDPVTWSYAVGIGAELSLAAPGLSPVFQVSYFLINDHWHHMLPIDIGGRYMWKRGRIDAYISGGMSILVIDRKARDDLGEIIHDWEVNPVIFADVGMRIMFNRHFGIEIRLEGRSYIVTNMIGLRLGITM